MRIGIVGAGLVGRLLGWRLQQVNCQVTLFDKDSIDGEQSCAYAAGGMLAPYAEMEKSETQIFELGLQSLKLWPQYLAQLSIPVYYAKQGSLLVAFEQERNNLLHFLARLRQHQLDQDVRLLDHQAIHKLEPELSALSQGLYLTEEAHLNPWELLHALKIDLLKKNVAWHELTEILDIRGKKVVAAKESLYFDKIFDCRGLGAKTVLPGLRGVRGEALLVHAPEVNLQRPIRFFHPRYPLYIVPRGQQYYYLGATEIESAATQAITVKSCLELLSAAYCVHSGFAEASIIKSLVNYRPAMPNHLPIIQYQDDVIRINGLYRHGFLLAPVLVEKAIKEMNDAQATF